MPELPEAEYMVRRLAEYASRAEIARARVLRASTVSPQSAAFFVRHARGRITRYWRRAKNVLVELDTGWTLRVQLGMTGHIYWVPDPKSPPRFTRVLLDLGRSGALAFEDARVFGSLHAHRTGEMDDVLAGFGPEPLDENFHWPQPAGLSQPVKAYLLDQARIAGLGNIWAAESLFRAHIHPQRPVGKLTGEEWRTLGRSIRKTLTRAVENAFKVTAGPADFPEADLQWLTVYGRVGKPCRSCRRPIVRTVLLARGTYFCPYCQR